MALQIWLPLNGTVKNNGLLGNLFTNATPEYSIGKLGKCLWHGGIYMSAEQAKQVLNNNEVSISFWIYINTDTGSTTNRATIFGNEDTGANNNRKFSLFTYPTCNDLHWSWMNDAANETFTANVLKGVLPSYKWTHVVFVYKNPNVEVYINGVLKKTASNAVSNSASFAYQTHIIHNSGYHLFSDFRIYDNYLSPKEVKELSKGLVMHYPLNDIYVTASTNKYAGDRAEGKCVSSGYLVTKLSNERGYNYKLNYTGTGSNAWFQIFFGSCSYIIGKTYDYSCKIRARSNTATNVVYLRASRSNNDWVTNMITINLDNIKDGLWHEFHVKQTITGSTYIRGSSTDTPTTAPCVEIYTESLSTKGTAYALDFDIKDVQLSECDNDAPISDGNLKSNIIYDASGFGNNGKVIGTPAWTSDSPRYDGCLKFDNLQYINGTCPWGETTVEQFTINIWINQISGGGYSTFLSSKGFGDWGLWLGINVEGYGQWAYRGGVDPNYAYGEKSLIDKNTWHMFTYVYNKDIVKWYLDGVLKSTTTYNGTGGFPFSSIITLGNIYNVANSWNTSFEGKLSDYRLYATILSDDDILELYNTPISITNNGALVTQGEFIEK